MNFKMYGMVSNRIVMARKSSYFSDSQKQGPNENQQKDTWEFSGIKGILLIVLVAVFVLVVCAAIFKKIFFASSSSTSTGEASVVSIDNKAMAWVMILEVSRVIFNDLCLWVSGSVDLRSLWIFDLFGSSTSSDIRSLRIFGLFESRF